MSQGAGVEHATVISVTSKGVMVHIDGWAPNSAAGPVAVPKFPKLGHYAIDPGGVDVTTDVDVTKAHADGYLSDVTVDVDTDVTVTLTFHPYVPHKGDRVIIGCIGGSLDDLVLLAVLN